MVSRDRISDWLRSVAKPLEKSIRIAVPVANEYADVFESGEWQVAIVTANIAVRENPDDPPPGFRNVEMLALAGLPIVNGDTYLPETMLSIHPGGFVIPAVFVLTRGIDNRPHIVSAGALGSSDGYWRAIKEVSFLNRV